MVQTASAHATYRLELWGSIRDAKGFEGGFCQWWFTRPIQLQGSPCHVQCGLPSLGCCEHLFQDFRANFTRFEAWSLAQRGKLLDARLQQSRNKLYAQLRTPKPDQVDTLTVHRNYAILAVEPCLAQVHVEGDLDTRGASMWKLNGASVSVSVINCCACHLSGVDSFDEGDELQQTQWLTSTEDVLAEFTALWRPRWQKHAHLDESHWGRVLDLAAAFMPRHAFVLPDLTVDMWARAVKRYKPRAAKGPDGWAKSDLFNMPLCYTKLLVQWLNGLENGEHAWPEQLLEDIVIALNKQNGRQDAQGYRHRALFVDLPDLVQHTCQTVVGVDRASPASRGIWIPAGP